MLIINNEFYAIFLENMIKNFSFLSWLVVGLSFLMLNKCQRFINYNDNRNFPNYTNQKFIYPSSSYLVLTILLIRKHPIIFNSWVVLLEISPSVSIIQRSVDWDGPSRTFTASCWSQWQMDLALCFGSLSFQISKCVPCASFPPVSSDNMLYSSCHQSWSDTL